MKNVLVIIVLMIFSSQLFAQDAEKRMQKPVAISTPSLAVSCAGGTYPNGNNCYPCLGCHPCGNSYCDDNSGKVITVKISDLKPLDLINEFEADGAITTKITKKDLVRLVLENSTKDNVVNNQKTRVKCGCGTDIYGKDAAACTRICDFLGSQAIIKH